MGVRAGPVGREAALLIDGGGSCGGSDGAGWGVGGGVTGSTAATVIEGVRAGPSGGVRRPCP